MQGVGGRQGIVHRIPVPELVGGVEPGHPEEGRVGDGPSKLLRRRTGPDGLRKGLHGRCRVVVQDGIGEGGLAAPPSPGTASLSPEPRQRLPGAPDHGGKVDGVAPGVQLLAAAGRGYAMDQAGQDLARVLPADVVQELEGLVAEVDDMAPIQVDAVRRGSKHHVGDLPPGDAEGRWRS